MRDKQTSRQWRIFHLLWYMKRGMSAEEIHAALDEDLHIKTVLRSMQAVANGFPDVVLARSNHKWVLRLDHARLLIRLQTPPEIKRKVCIGCKQKKFLDEFHNCRSYPDGKWQECKLCRNEYNREYYAANYKRTRVTKRAGDGRFMKTTGKTRRRKFELRGKRT